MRVLGLCAALLLVGLSACTPKEPINVAPAWSTDSGRRQTQLSMCEDFLDHGLLPQAFDLIAAMQKDGLHGPELDYLRGRALYLSGQYTQAETLLVSAAEHMRRDARPHATLGVLYADTNRVEEAIASLRKATEFDPKKAAYWNNLGFLLLSEDDPASAVSALETAVALEGTEARYRNNLGFALAAAGRFDEAMRTFGSAGDPSDALTNMGVAYEVAEQPDTAREHYEAALEYHPKHHAARQALERLDAPEESP